MLRNLALASFLALWIAAGGISQANDPPEIPKHLLRSDDWKKRIEGLDRLASRGDDPRAVKAALPLLDDEDWEVRIHATTTLGKLGGKQALKALLDQAVHGEIAWLRQAAVDGLKAWDGAETAGRLLERMRVLRSDESRSHALEAVGALAPATLLGNLRLWVRHKGLRIAAAAVRAVGRIAARDPAGYEEALELLDLPLSRRAERKHFLAYAAAIDAIGGMDHPRARVWLARELLRLPDEDPYIPTRIARHLGAMDPVRVRAAVNDAQSLVNAPHLQRRLVRLVGEAHVTPLTTLLTKYLRVSRDEGVAAAATRSLGLLGDAGTEDTVRRSLRHQAPRVRLEAVTALGHLLDAATFRDLLQTILADESWEVRRQFVVELNDQGDPAAIPVLASLVRDKDWRVATAAIATIGTFGIASDLALLEPLLRHRDWKVRATAYEAMGRLRAAKAIPHLSHGLEDKDPVVRSVCLANLQILTRQDIGPEPKAWRRWWLKHGRDLHLRKRSRMTPEEKKAEESERSKSRYAHDKYRFERKHGVEILQKARILVVKGAWDHVEIVLDHLDIPHTAIRAQQVKEVGLNPNQVVLVNCEGNIDKGAQERLRWFVNVGGYLMTTDWALTKTVEPCFPGYMAQYSGSTTGNDVVVVEETNPGHPFTAGIFENVPALMWWLEIRSFPITVTYPERCDVIVDSAEMKQRYGSSVMATVFRWGLGKVQHSVSHFYLQEEGMQMASKPLGRMIFAADNLGLSLEQIRRLEEMGGFEGQPNEASMREIAPDYSMFRIIVHVVKEKSDWVEGL